MARKYLILLGCMAIMLVGCAGTTASHAGAPFYMEDSGMLQFSPLQEGDTLVILHTSAGDITLRFFPEETPMAYENFVTHARNGYYDGTIFHRTIEDFMIQGGCPDGQGTGGESIWGHTFGPEYSPHLWHFRGALAMAQTARPDSIGSQFYIVQNAALDPHMHGMIEGFIHRQDELQGVTPEGESVYLRDWLPLEAMEAYLELGGTPHLDIAILHAGREQRQGHTVFGHVVDGMDVVDTIAAGSVFNDRPLVPVVIQSVTVTTYGR